MKKLEDMPRENIFKVPEGYFEKLPMEIQARVAKPEPKVWFAPPFKFALPLAAIAIAATVWFSYQQGGSIEDQLNEIQTEQLIAYLGDSDLHNEALTEEITWSETDLEELEDEVFLEMEPIDVVQD